MDIFDYSKLSLLNDMSVKEYMEKECNKILSYHSYSPQYDFYASEFNEAMDSLVYKGLISVSDYDFLIKKVRDNRDTETQNLVSPIMVLLGRYKPRLKLIDWLTKNLYFKACV